MDKASWDEASKKLFLDLCVEMIHAGKKPNKTLTKEGRQYVYTEFNERTGRNMSDKQFKNFWDYLRRSWNTFQDLRRMAIGLGCSFEKGTITASEDWWKTTIEANNKFSKFRERGLPFYDEMEIIFGGTSTSGQYSWVANSGTILTQLEPTPDLNMRSPNGHGAANLRADEVEVAENNLNDLPSPVQVSTSGFPGGSLVGGKRQHSSAVSGSVNHFTSSLLNARLTDRDFLTQTYGVSKTVAMESMAMELVKLRDRLTEEEFFFGMDYLLNGVKHIAFTAITDEEGRVGFIKFMYMQYRGGNPLV